MRVRLSPADRASASLAVLFAALGAAVAIVLLREHLTVFQGDVAGGLFCGGGGRFDCNTVAAAPSSWWLGYPVAMWGVVFYIAMATLAILTLELPAGERAAATALGVVLAFTAVLLDGYLATLMVTRIGAICLNCVATYVLNLALAVTFWLLDSHAGVPPDWRGLLLGWWPLVLPRAAASDAQVAPDTPAEPPPVPAAAPEGPPARAAKLGLGLVSLAATVVVIGLTARSVSETLADSRDEAQEFLSRYATEAPVDMKQFEGRPTEGPADARLTIVVASDFECSFCRALAERLDQLRAEYPHDVRLIFLNAPISNTCNPVVKGDFHPHACWLAKAGICAAEHGKFWEYHDLVYKAIPLPQVDEATVNARIGSIGIPADGLDRCARSAEADSVLARDVRLYRDLGMKSVPSLVINGHVKTGGIYPTTLRAIVRALLAERS